MISKGCQFGRWVIFGDQIKDEGGRTLHYCRCSCGKERYVREYYLLSGRSKSCGCITVDKNRDRKTHGLSLTREYKIWRGMKGRCLNKTHSAYAQYGGRGIGVCKRWQDRFESFLEDMGPAPNNYTLERVDVNGDYHPDNCVWATWEDQARNVRPKTESGIVGVTRCGSSWRAQIHSPFGKKHLGNYKNFFDACCARKSAEILFWAKGAIR